jgi:hypothetical protein
MSDQEPYISIHGYTLATKFDIEYLCVEHYKTKFWDRNHTSKNCVYCKIAFKVMNTNEDRTERKCSNCGHIFYNQNRAEIEYQTMEKHCNANKKEI